MGVIGNVEIEMTHRMSQLWGGFISKEKSLGEFISKEKSLGQFIVVR